MSCPQFPETFLSSFNKFYESFTSFNNEFSLPEKSDFEHYHTSTKDIQLLNLNCVYISNRNFYCNINFNSISYMFLDRLVY